jgi:hypothetical protein
MCTFARASGAQGQGWSGLRKVLQWPLIFMQLSFFLIQARLRFDLKRRPKDENVLADADKP